MRIHLRADPLYPYAYLCVSVAVSPFSTGIFGVAEQQGLWELAKVNGCSRSPLFLCLHILSTQHNGAHMLLKAPTIWPLSQHYMEMLYPVAFCLMSFGNADNAKATVQHALCWYSHSSSFSRLIITHNYCTKGGGQCAAFWPFMMLPTDCCSEDRQWSRRKYWHFSFFCLSILPLIVPERPVRQSWEECGQLLWVAQRHYRVIDLLHFLWLSGELFTVTQHEAMNICETAHSKSLAFTHSWLK